MAAGTWSIFPRAKFKLGGTKISFSGDTFNIALFLGTASISGDLINAKAGTSDFSVIGSLPNELAEANGYSSSGKAVTDSWTLSTADGVYANTDTSGVFWSANGGNFANVQYAVLIRGNATSGGQLVAYVTLSTAAFTVNDGSRLSINVGGADIIKLV